MIGGFLDLIKTLPDYKKNGINEFKYSSIGILTRKDVLFIQINILLERGTI
jgi:hypothetical protein